MSELDDAIENLNAAIKKTQEYQDYEREKDKVGRIPKLKEQIDEFRIRNYEMQNRSDDKELFHKMDEFEQKYEKFRENPLVADFLAAELAFCRMMQMINIRVTESLDFDLTV